MNIELIGNCQTAGVADGLLLMFPECQVRRLLPREDIGTRGDVDLFVVQKQFERLPAFEMFPDIRKVVIPSIVFSGYHPDQTFVYHNKEMIGGPLHHYQSAIAFGAWRLGIPSGRAKLLFNDKVYSALGYFGFDQHQAELEEYLRSVDYPSEMASEWKAAETFMHASNHPRLRVLADVASEVLKKVGVKPVVERAEQYLADGLKMSAIWPVYPEIARRLGVDGSYNFKPRQSDYRGRPAPILDLPTYIEMCYATYASLEPGAVSCRQADDPKFLEVLASHDQAKNAHQTHPYRGLPDHQFWSRAVARVDRADVDPIVSSTIRISQKDRIGTGGSCFAQHVAKELKRSGFNYYIAEDTAGLSAEEIQSRNFGVFSTRYGNIYTAKQLRQLFERSFENLQPKEEPWQRPDGRWVDPFRPEIEPNGYKSADEVRSATIDHLKDVRLMFESIDVYLFTLGLTESWRRRDDGVVFPLAPGVVAGSMDPAKYEFVNFETEEIAEDLRYFVERLRDVNPRAKLLLTVSPVPLIATYEPRHVLVSATYSKAALRVAADKIEREFSNVSYLPSYEIITGNHAGSDYYESDLRSVKAEGVSHVMKVFMRHHTIRPALSASGVSQAAAEMREIICDEEKIEASLK